MARLQSGKKREGGPSQLESDEAPDRASIPDETGRLDLITRRAYERFQMRGGDHGRDQDDWFEAERELSQHKQE